MCGLGVRGVGVLLLLGGFSCQVWLQRLSKIFALRSSGYLLPPSSRHVGCPPLFLLFNYLNMLIRFLKVHIFTLNNTVKETSLNVLHM
jgi:hypothetical protein